MKINANGTEIEIMANTEFNEDYLCLTDLARRKNPYEPKDVVKNWLRLRSTIEFLGLWEQLYNPNFKGVEFDTFKNEAGSNTFTLTPQRWIEKTRAIGLITKSGRGAELLPIKILLLNSLPGFLQNLNYMLSKTTNG